MSHAVTYLTEADCRDVLTPSEVLSAIEETLLWDAEGGVSWSEPRSLKMSDSAGNGYHVKACVLDRGPVAGVRLVAHQKDESGNQAARLITLVDPATWQPLALVDETWNYAQRAAAVMALAARKLVPSGATPGADPGAPVPSPTLALVGAGRLAAAALTYYSHLFGLAEVRISSRREETRTELARRASRELGLRARPVASIRDAVIGADLVLTCTSAGRALLEPEWVSPGAVVAALDTAEPGARLFRQADLIVVDSLEQLEGELVQIYGPDAPGLVKATITEVLSGRHPGRATDGDRVLVISQGLASLDVALAYRAYRLAREREPQL